MRDWYILSATLAFLSACAETVPYTVQNSAYTSPIHDPSLSPELEAESISNTIEFTRPPSDIPQAEAKWLRAAPIQSQIDTTSSNPFWIGIWVELPNEETRQTRPPIALSLVVDTSGSMSGTKIDHAQQAVKSFIESLNRNDIVSIYAFSNTVTEIAPPTIINDKNRIDLIARAGDLQAMGSTNLFGGLSAGQSRAVSAPPTHPIRRVVVLSDGQANIGPLSPKALGDLAARGTEAGVQVSAVGIGLDYDEHTLGAMAIRSAGRLYHLEDPSEMSTILKDELQLLSKTAASNVFLEIEPGEGIELTGAEFVDAQQHGGTLRIALGTLYNGQQREILIQAKTHLKSAGPIQLGNARLIYRVPGDKNAPWQAQRVSLSAALTSNAIAAKASENADVKAMVARYASTRAELRAADMLNQGRVDEAVKEYKSAEQQLQSAATLTKSDEKRRQLTAQAARMSQRREDASKVTSKPQARSRSLHSYSYAFDSAGY